MLKSSLIKIWRGSYESEGQKSDLQDIKLLYKAREAAIKLFNDYISITY